MRKFTFSFKSLLVACGLLAGSANAWADWTTTTYDFTEMGTSSITLSSTGLGHAYRQACKIPNEAVGTDADKMNSKFGFNGTKVSVSSSGLSFSGDQYMVISGFQEGDILIPTYTGSEKFKAVTHKSGSGNTPIDLTSAEGKEVAIWYNLINNGYHFATYTTSLGFQTKNGLKITKIVVKHNDSENYLNLFRLFKTVGNSSYASSLTDAIAAAKDVLVNEESTESNYTAAYNTLRAAYKSAIADGHEIVGEPDYSTGWCGVFNSTPIQIKAGEKARYIFVNYNSGSGNVWNNWYLAAKATSDTGGANVLGVRADQYTDGSVTQTNTLADFNYISDYNGATVTIDLELNDAGGGSYTFVSTTTIKKASGDAVTGRKIDTNTGLTQSSLYIYLSVNNAYLKMLAQGPTINETLNTNMSGYKTFYNATTNYQVDENTTIYKAAAPSEGKVVLTDVGGNKIIKADQPVILHTSAATIEITPSATASTGNFDGNELKVAAGTESGKYVLGYTAEKGFGFYYYTATLLEGYIYLDGDAPSVKMLNVIVDGTATGVEAPVAAETAEEDGVLYNTAGQIVTKDYKGIVIKNGKKYLNK